MFNNHSIPIGSVAGGNDGMNYHHPLNPYEKSDSSNSQQQQLAKKKK
jgi:hypothetical protein